MRKMIKNKGEFFRTHREILKNAGCEDYKKSIKIFFFEAFGTSFDQIA